MTTLDGRLDRLEHAARRPAPAERAGRTAFDWPGYWRVFAEQTADLSDAEQAALAAQYDRLFGAARAEGGGDGGA